MEKRKKNNQTQWAGQFASRRETQVGRVGYHDGAIEFRPFRPASLCDATEFFEEAGAGELERDCSTEMADPAREPWDEDAVYSIYPRLVKKYRQ